MLSPSQIHLFPYFHFFITCFLKNISVVLLQYVNELFWFLLTIVRDPLYLQISCDILQSCLFRSSCGASAKISFLIPQFKVISKLFLKIFYPQFFSSFFIFKRLSCEAGCKCKTLFFVSKPSHTFFLKFFSSPFQGLFLLFSFSCEAIAKVISLWIKTNTFSYFYNLSQKRQNT